MAVADKQPEPYKARLATKLQELRATAEKTQQQVAEETGIHESTVRNYELGRRMPKPEHLQGLADALGVAPEALHPYDFVSNPDIAFHALMRLCDDYGFDVVVMGEDALVVSTTDFMHKLIEHWAAAYETSISNEKANRVDYERWKDSYRDEFNELDFPHIYPEFDPSDAEAEQRWRMAQLSETLVSLRKARRMTQDDLAKATGISKFTIRSYEQEKRYPKDDQSDVLADALGASHGALRFFYFGCPNQAAHALFKLCDELGLYPSKKDVAIKPQESNPYRYAFVEWAQKREELAASDATEGDVQRYKLWEAEFALEIKNGNNLRHHKEHL